jgi:hypothetical protein
LNISWIADALERPASVICPRSGACPRQSCLGADATPSARATAVT